MKIVNAFAEILSASPDLEQTIELSGRTCYKSEDKITDGSAAAFVSKIRSINHESVLEHGAITVRFVCDRGVSHELVRHRIASFSQESTRYCNYCKDKFGNEITVVDPRPAFPEMSEGEYLTWEQAMEEAESAYFAMIELGSKAQLARDVLPNSLKTEVVMTTNPREWRHVFKLRCADAAHPQMREVMIPLRDEFARRWPALFADLTESAR
jgi:thymidylate synthase (FAD)